MTALSTETLEYVANQPDRKVAVFVATKEQADLAGEIAAMYEAALGKGGVGGEGFEAYPDPDLFSEKGMHDTLVAQERMIAVARSNESESENKNNGEIVGAMVADRLSPYHVEFNSMAVRRDRRGQRIGSAIVEGLKEIFDESDLTVNTTELVTHSLASQAAHFGAGYRSIVGFAFCHYPSVFFANHPESVLWVCRFQGKLVSAARQIRLALGRQLGSNSRDVIQNILTAQAQQRFSLATGRLSEEQLQLIAELLMARTAYVPAAYTALVQQILFQFEELLDRSVKARFFKRAEVETESESEPTNQASADTPDLALKPVVEVKEGFGHSYIIYKNGFVFDQALLDKEITELQSLGKRYILVRIPANQPEAIAMADYLRTEKGFVFHSYLPLYGYDIDVVKNQHKLYDILTLQWIAPAILAENSLPGETNSVVKLHGYPENLSGPLIKLIASELDSEKTNARK
jgi:hypothetical protein